MAEVKGIPGFSQLDKLNCREDLRLKGEPVVTGSSKTAFGELSVESLTPITQVSAQYGVLSGVLTVIDTGSSGSTTVIDEKYTCDSGTAADGLASITTLRQLAYKSGQGAACRITALFDTPQPDSTQAAGLITSENSFAFGYEGLDFGIIHSYGGKDELQELTITSFATGAEVATVTINGIGYNVNLSGGGSVSIDAYEIATQLTGQVPSYQFTSNQDQVVAQSLTPFPQGGAFAYSSATSAGSWVQLVAGVEPTRDFVKQCDWNENTKEDLNPQMGNVYQVKYQYLGFGDIKFFVEDSDSGDFVLVHTIRYANNNEVPSVTNPTFRIGWLVLNRGNTTSLRIQGSSAAGFVEGSLLRDESPRSQANEQLSVGTTLTNVITIRNRISFGGKVNRADIYPLIASAASQTTKAAFFFIIASPEFASPVNFQYEDKDSSIAEFATDSVEVSSGRQIGAVTVVDSGSQIIEFNTRDGFPTVIQPGVTLCLAAQMASGSASDCQGSVTWTEDL